MIFSYLSKSSGIPQLLEGRASSLFPYLMLLPPKGAVGGDCGSALGWAPVLCGRELQWPGCTRRLHPQAQAWKWQMFQTGVQELLDV